MIKRMSKVTSLLVAAAAVVSLIPATGVSAAERLATKEGTIESAIAFDGGYIFDGYKSEDDETGIYYNDGDEDKLLEDVDSIVSEYGTKYAIVADGNDEYLVDLSNGAILEDKTADDIKDNVASKLKSTLSKTDRYGKVTSTDKITLTEITEKQFGETWYSYTTTGASATHSGYVNDAGKYIDTDLIANLYVFNGTRMVKIEEFGKENKDYKLKADLVDAETIAEDKDNIYRIIEVSVTDTATNVTAPDNLFFIQKISKAQGETEDDAYLPKTVASYEITDAFDSGDADDAKTVLNNLTGADVRVINGVIYVTTNDGSEVNVTSIKLKKNKVARDGGSTKLDVYLAEKDVDESQDIMGSSAVSIDVNGNTWALNKGNIYKFNGSEFEVVYNVDRAMDTLEVYNAESLLVWEDGEDVYATVEKAVETPVEETPAPVVTTGWVQNADGTWSFNKVDGTKATGWVKDGSTWYFLKADGVMATGWVKDGSTWYFLNASGAMRTGWVKDGANWYYLKASGAMATGWINDNGTWYYLNGSGAMLSNTTVNGYKLGASGAWIR